jgi:hypothetical protein
MTTVKICLFGFNQISIDTKFGIFAPNKNYQSMKTICTLEKVM